MPVLNTILETEISKENSSFSGYTSHLASQPDRYYTTQDDDGNDVRVQIGSTYSGSDDYSEIDNSSSPWAELFIARTVSKLKKSEKGRVSHQMAPLYFL